MIKSKDLMIGNWLQHYNGKYYQVIRVDPTHFACGHPHLWEYNNKFYPIQIDSRLLDNLFNQKDGEYFIDNIVISYDDASNDWDISKIFGGNYTYITTVKYVHELQNVLRWIDVDINIDKYFT